jgi:hypothetical protein
VITFPVSPFENALQEVLMVLAARGEAVEAHRLLPLLLLWRKEARRTQYRF